MVQRWRRPSTGPPVAGSTEEMKCRIFIELPRAGWRRAWANLSGSFESLVQNYPGPAAGPGGSTVGEQGHGVPIALAGGRGQPVGHRDAEAGLRTVDDLLRQRALWGLR